MPLLDIQRQAAQIGNIRIGQQVATTNGKMRPAKLDTFRLTTGSSRVAQQAAALLGGTAQPWTHGAPRPGMWEVITDVTELPVTIPPGPDSVSQWYELWTAAGCQRRCDGVTERNSGDPCMCPPDHGARGDLAKSGEACRTTTRLNVILPDLQGVGVWLMTTRGYYAARELGGTAEMLAEAATRHGLMLPAMLRIEQREVRRPGQRPKQFPVPVLEVLASMHEIQAAAAGEHRIAPLPPPVRALAIEAGQPAGAAPAALAARQETVEQHARTGRAQAAADALTNVTAPQGDEPPPGRDEVLKRLNRIAAHAAHEGLLDDPVQVPGDDALWMLGDYVAARRAHFSEGDQR